MEESPSGSASKGIRKKPYQKPAFNKITAEEAHAILERQAPDNAQGGDELLEEVKRLLERD